MDRELLSGQTIDFCILRSTKFPINSLHVLLELLWRGGASDHAGDLWSCREPGECKLQQGVAACGGECFKPLGDNEIRIIAVRCK